ncbi:MAG: cadmium resistance transporter [Nostoc sp. LLA-1]|nr:cadmium resistance transporter [Cyanocohniella sp. LLY]
MNELLTAISTGLTAFVATNLDDILVLSLFFSQINTCFRRRHIVIGQYLGFSTLVVASLPSFFGKFILPEAWIGLLGMVPIMIGIHRLFHQETDEQEDFSNPEASSSWWSNFLSPQSYSVAAVTIANGGDNISIYMPMFATHTWDSLLVILAAFFVMVGVWCYTAYRLTQVSAIASFIARYGNPLVPFILIGLGVSILMQSHTLKTPALTVVTCVSLATYLLIASKNTWQEIYSFSLGSADTEIFSKIKK